MKRIHSSILCILCGLFLLCSCHEEIYDPEALGKDYFIQNIPSDFTWSTTSSVQTSVIPYDRYEGQYLYTIEIFDKNPLTDPSAVLYTTGWCTGKQPLQKTITVPAVQKTLYIRQTTPGGRKSIKEAEIKNNKLDCSFYPEKNTSSTPATTRAYADERIPENVPADANEIKEGPNNVTLEANKNYVIRETYTGKITFPGSGNSSLYITGTWINPNNMTVLNKGSDIYIMGTGKLLSSAASCTFKWNSAGGVMGIAPGGQLGTPEQNNIGLEFHNPGAVINEGNFYGDWITANAAGMLFVNKGKFYANGLTTSDVAFLFRNECYAHIKKFKLNNQSILTVSPDCSFFSEDFSMVNSSVYLGNSAMLEVGTLTTANWGSPFIQGNGNDYALVRIDKMICPSRYAPLNFISNLYISCNQYPADPWTYNILFNCMLEDVSTGATIEIKPSECSQGNDYVPEQPEEPEFPKTVTYTQTYTFASEDNYPNPGDYDMNDIVLSLDSTSYHYPQKNGIDRVTLHFTLRAVGATRQLGAALQLDRLGKESVKSVSYSTELPLDNFYRNGNSTEQKQKQAVIPLFDNAHQILGYSNTTTIVNTIQGGATAKPVSFDVTIEFSSLIQEEDIQLDAINYFTIVGTRLPRTEIHLPRYKHTNLSVTPAKLQEVTQQYMWSIRVPGIFRYPQEWRKITDVYPQFEAWVKSSGKDNADWYIFPEEHLIYRN